MSKLTSTAFKLTAYWFIVTVVTGCSGMAKVELIAPVVPVLEPAIAERYPLEIGHSKYSRNIVSFTRRDIDVRIFPVNLSEDLKWIFGPAVVFPVASEEVTNDGPLSIDVAIRLKFGTASFDPQDFVVLLGESRRLLKPHQGVPVILKKQLMTQSQLSDQRSADAKACAVHTHPNSFNSCMSNRSAKPAEHPHGKHFSFTYDISRQDLSRFVFRLGDIDVNGMVVSFPEVTFKRASEYVNR
jgi:hypothetical protein